MNNNQENEKVQVPEGWKCGVKPMAPPVTLSLDKFKMPEPTEEEKQRTLEKLNKMNK